MSDASPGWHPDPHGRHQYRFWDGSRWTDQVADSGQQSTDPFEAAQAGASDVDPSGTVAGFGPSGGPPGQGAGPPPGAPPGGASPIGYGGFDPPPPAKRNNLPLIIGIGVAVAILVGIAVVLLLGGDDDSGTGDGDVTLELKANELATHDLNLSAGDALYVKASAPNGKGVRGAMGVETSVADRLSDGGFLSDSDNRGIAGLASDLFSDFSDYPIDDISSDKPEFSGGGFNGFIIQPISAADDDSRSFADDTIETVAFTGGKYTLLFIAEEDTEVKLQIRVKKNPDVKDDIASDQISDLNSDFYTDFFTDATDQLSD